MQITESPEIKIIRERVNHIYQYRRDQLTINLLGYAGGSEYINARLSRFAGESTIPWEGGNRGDGSVVTGRKNQAHCAPNLRRIIDKITQFLMAIEPERDVSDTTILDNITRDGITVNQFMADISVKLNVCGWCWLGIDMPRVDQPETLSLQQKEIAKIRPYWLAYSPLDVVDWAFDNQGNLLWLLALGEERDNFDPYRKEKVRKYRALWQPGMVTKYIYGTDSDIIIGQEVIPFTYSGVPFVLVGTPSKAPHIFDDLERVNRSIMDLESCSRQNFFEMMFPQMYLSASVLDSTCEKLKVEPKEALQYIVGLHYPLLLAEGDVIPGYIMPPVGEMGGLRTEIKELRAALYDAVGLMLRSESKQQQTAESKAWDHLDIEQMLSSQAEMLEEAERVAVRISHEWDPTFPEYDPKYNRKFNISDLVQDMQTLILSAQLAMPDEMMKLVLRKVYKVITKIGGSDITEEEKQSILDAIDNYNRNPMLSTENEQENY